MKKEKLKLYGSVIKKHKKLETTLYIITFIPLIPFAILNSIGEGLVKLCELIGGVRQKVVYGLLRAILRKELEEVRKTDKNI